MISLRREDIPDFNPTMRVVGCFVWHQERFLMLRRVGHKPQPFSWCAPSGKVGGGEPISYAMARELGEDTGLRPTLYQYLGVTYARYPEYDFVYYLFSTEIRSCCPKVCLSPGEHDHAVWVSPVEALQLNLIPDMDFCIENFAARA